MKERKLKLRVSFYFHSICRVRNRVIGSFSVWALVYIFLYLNLQKSLVIFH